MTGAAPERLRLDLAPQRGMFALEFRDPIRDEAVAAGLQVTAGGLRPPTVTPSNRFVWLDRGTPRDRRIRVQAVSTDGMYAPFDEFIDVPAHLPDVPLDRLIIRCDLRPTGLYEPPSGMTAVGGMLVEGDGSRKPVVGAGIRIRFRHAERLEVFTGEAALGDSRGGFTAVLHNLDDVKPDPLRKLPGWFNAWLSVEREGEVRTSETLVLRLGRLTRIPVLEWAALGPPWIEDDPLFG